MLSKYHEKIKIIQGWHYVKYLKKMFPTCINANCKFIMFKLGLIFDITIKKITDEIYSLARNGLIH